MIGEFTEDRCSTSCTRIRGVQMIKEFQSIARRIQDDFERTRDMPHQGVKGSTREQSVTGEFLTKYLPPKYSIGSGLIADSEGNFSRQQDIIIYDGFNSPVLQDFQSNKVLFAEQVFAAIEVKSVLNSSEIIDIILKSSSISSLTRKGMYSLPPPTPAVDKSSGIFVFGFAYESTMTLENIRDIIQEKVNETQAAWGISSLIILSDRDGLPGIITNLNPIDITNITIFPSKNSPLVRVKMDSTGEALFLFYLQLLQALGIAEASAVSPDYLAYAKRAGFGKVDAAVGLVGMQQTHFLEAIETLKNAHLRADSEVLDSFFYLMKQGEGFVPGGSHFDPNTRFTIGKEIFIDDPKPADVWESLSRYKTGNVLADDIQRLSQLLWMLRKVSREDTYLAVVGPKSNEQE